jgi:hypothetical protein
MDGVSIIGVALGVGVVVYALSLRSVDASLDANGLPAAPTAARTRFGFRRAEPPTGAELGFGATAAGEAEADAESFLYVPVLAAPGPHWRTRIGGVIGLLAIVTIAAVLVALGIYQLGHALNQLIQQFLGHVHPG